MQTDTNRYEDAVNLLRRSRKTWLVTGVAGFIGSNVLELLLQLDQTVVGLDNFATGHRENIRQVVSDVEGDAASNFRLIEGDVCNLETCREACSGVDYVLHQAALGSVPRSIVDPIATNQANIVGFLNMLVAARDAGVKQFVYAASSSTYGDHPGLSKVENAIGRPLSPYALTKYVDELYADMFKRCYELSSIGLRYFNVFGRRQDPNGPYAAVIPKWVSSLLSGKPCYIYGDGETSRDFCYIDNVLQANVLAAMASFESPRHEVYNVACGCRTSLNQLFLMLREGLAQRMPELETVEPIHRDFRAGDVRHSLADISKITEELGYSCVYSAEAGINAALDWYIQTYTGLGVAG